MSSASINWRKIIHLFTSSGSGRFLIIFISEVKDHLSGDERKDSFKKLQDSRSESSASVFSGNVAGAGNRQATLQCPLSRLICHRAAVKLVQTLQEVMWHSYSVARNYREEVGVV